MSYFNRAETVDLTGLSLSQLMTLEKNKLVIPTRGEARDNSGASILYSWPQVIEIRAIAKLRQSCSYPTLKRAAAVLQEMTNQPNLSDKRLVAYGNEVYWIVDNPQNFHETVTQLTGANPGQILISFTCSELIAEIRQRSRQVIDFTSRAQLGSLVAV